MTRPENWRWLTPIFTVISTVLISCFSFFLVRMINQFDKHFDTFEDKLDHVMVKMDSQFLDYRDYRETTEHRLTKLEQRRDASLR